MLTQENPYCSKLDEKAREVVNEKSQGSLVFVYDPKEEDPESDDISFVLVGWRGKHSVRSYIPKGERQHILRMCNFDLPADSVDPPSTPKDSNTPQNSSPSRMAQDASPSETPGDVECTTQGDKPAANGGEPDPTSETMSEHKQKENSTPCNHASQHPKRENNEVLANRFNFLNLNPSLQTSFSFLAEL